MFEGLVFRFRVWSLNRRQKRIDDLFLRDGFSGELLEEQMVLNLERSELGLEED